MKFTQRGYTMSTKAPAVPLRLSEPEEILVEARREFILNLAREKQRETDFLTIAPELDAMWKTRFPKSQVPNFVGYLYNYKPQTLVQAMRKMTASKTEDTPEYFKEVVHEIRRKDLNIELTRDKANPNRRLRSIETIMAEAAKKNFPGFFKDCLLLLANLTICTNGCVEWNTTPTSKAITDHFTKFVKPSGATAKNPDKKYDQMTVRPIFNYDHSLSVARILWVFAHQSIPDGSILLNTCGNQKCVSPTHQKLSK